MELEKASTEEELFESELEKLEDTDCRVRAVTSLCQQTSNIASSLHAQQGSLQDVLTLGVNG